MPIALNNRESFDSINSVIDQLLQYTTESARKNDLIRGNEDWFFDAQMRDNDLHKRNQLLQAAIAMSPHKHNTESYQRVANYLGANRLVLNALDNFYRASVVPSPRDRFQAFFEEGLSGDDAKRTEFVQSLKAASDKMILSIVQTTHPTIYHTPFAQERETELTGILEKIADHIKDGENPNTEIARAKASIDRLFHGIAKDGQSLTPNQKLKLAEEDAFDHHNHMQIRDNFRDVIKNYNDALAEAAKKHPELKGAEIRESQIEYRTWAQGGDASRRDRSTALQLYNKIYYQVDADRGYHSRIRDARDNAKDHINIVSCMIQRGQIDRGEEKYPFIQQQAPEVQVRILRELIEGNTKLLPEVFRDETIAFCKMFSERFPQFLKDCETLYGVKVSPDIETDTLKDIPIDTEKYPDAPRNVLLAVCNFISDERVDVGNEKNVQFRLNPGDYTYERVRYHRDSQFFQGCSTPADKKDRVGKPLGNSERNKLSNLVRRLYVFDHAVDEFGNKVANRYQISNFGSKADFYAAMLLFKETGILNIKDGKVDPSAPPKLAIQPLLETADDQRRAPEMFRELLRDDLVRSYYKAVGDKAQFMVSFGDGAKSGGIFASEWTVYTSTRKLHEVFAEQGIELRIFYGRGRGDSRGGQFDTGQDQRMVIPELARNMVYDVSWQSDLPMTAAISDSFGKDICASTIAGTITAHNEAPKWLNKDFSREEKLIENMAKISEKKYVDLVGENPNTLRLLDVVHDNTLRSSYPTAGGTPQNLENVGAITAEYGFNMVDAPLHYIGMKSALESIVAQPGGQERLKHLYHDHPFFRGMMDKTSQGIINYDPEVFRQYARVAGVSDWAERCVRELDGLREMVSSIREPEYKGKSTDTVISEIISSRHNSREANAADQATLLELNPLAEREHLLDRNAHAMALSMAVEGGRIQSATRDHNPLKPDDHSLSSAMRLLTFTCQAVLPSKMLHPSARTRTAVDGFKSL